MPYDPVLAARVRELLAGEPGLSEKKMVDGDQTAATELLTLLERALAPGTTTGTAASLANLPDSVAPAKVPTASPAPSSGEHRGCTLPGENHDPE